LASLTRHYCVNNDKQLIFSKEDKVAVKVLSQEIWEEKGYGVKKFINKLPNRN